MDYLSRDIIHSMTSFIVWNEMLLRCNYKTKAIGHFEGRGRILVVTMVAIELILLLLLTMTPVTLEWVVVFSSILCVCVVSGSNTSPLIYNLPTLKWTPWDSRDLLRHLFVVLQVTFESKHTKTVYLTAPFQFSCWHHHALHGCTYCQPNGPIQQLAH